MEVITARVAIRNLKVERFTLTFNIRASLSDIWDRFHWATTGDNERLNFIACKVYVLIYMEHTVLSIFTVEPKIMQQLPQELSTASKFHET